MYIAIAALALFAAAPQEEFVEIQEETVIYEDTSDNEELAYDEADYLESDEVVFDDAACDESNIHEEVIAFDED